MLSVNTPDSSRVIWRVIDGRVGHRNQVFGLTDAIQRHIRAKCYDIHVTGHLEALRWLLPNSTENLNAPPPDLLIGAGHATHLPLLILRRRFGGRAIVLMKPTIPMMAFDLNIISSVHDPRKKLSNVILSDGPLNRMQPSESLSDSEGLILVGGHSDHFVWNDENILRQVTTILTANEGIRWKLTTSRRTPRSFLKAWTAARLPGELVPWDEVSPDWVVEQLKRSGRVWVTSDSQSMMFEALTVGAAVGILELPECRKSWGYLSAKELIRQGRVTPWSAWMAGDPLKPSNVPLREADRCAIEVIRRFMPEHVTQSWAA